MRVLEIFDSIQGEGVWAGVPMTFVRLAGCNGLVVEPGVFTLVRHARQLGPEGRRRPSGDRGGPAGHHARVCVTGGEPMLQGAEVAELAALLRSSGGPGAPRDQRRSFPHRRDPRSTGSP